MSTIIHEKQSLQFRLGSYCWKSLTRGVCVDTPVPPELVDDMLPFLIKPGGRIAVEFKKKPQNLEIKRWEKGNSLPQGNVTPVALEVFNQTYIFTVPEENGNYIYEILATWPEGSGSMALKTEVVDG